MPVSRRRRLARAAVLPQLVVLVLIPLVPLNGVAAQELPAPSVGQAPVQQADPPAETCPAGEITSARGRDRKIFRNEDCTYTALYGRYLHYEKAPGQWEDVDLNFRQDGTGYVMDRHDIVVRIDGNVLRATERVSGKGVRWVMPMPPVVAGRSARFSAGGLQWEYTTRKSGLKLSATVPAPLGQRTWEFPYQLAGGAAALSVDQDGSLISDVFSVPRPFALGADGNVYDVSEWRLLPPSRVAFDFDDSALPAEAFPYELDPTTTFSVATGTDDGHVNKNGIVYPPTGGATASTGSSTISTMRSVTDSCPAASPPFGTATGSIATAMGPPPLCPNYDIQNALIRWDTSALPDSAVVTGATLRAYVSAIYNDDDTRLLNADWYTAWPIDAADYSEAAQSSAIGGYSIIDLDVGADNDLALSNPGFYVSKTGYTGLRMHVSGGQPAGRNQVDIRAYESTTSPEPRLLVTYSTPPDISSASDTPDPVTAGDPITFSASWTDADPGDSVRAVICKTNQVSAGSCPGGAWGIGSLSGTSPSAASFTPTALHHGTQTYYAFACDAAGSCSSSLSGTFTVQNRAPTVSSVSDSPDPITAGSATTFSTSWTDPGDSVRAVICKTNQVSAGSCPGGAWGIGSLSGTSPSAASFTPTALHHGTQTYYAFACDAAGSCSSSLSGTFTVQNRAPTVSSVSDAPDPVTAGDAITFSASWTDPDDSVRALFCKTNQVSSGSCPGGAWAASSLSGTSPSTASFTPTAAHHGSQTYYAFACDSSGGCSSPLSATFAVQNRAPTISSVSDVPDPVTAGDAILFTASWSDPDDSVRTLICKTNQVSSGSCQGGSWVVGSLSGTSPSTASFTPTAAQHGAQTYYAFACDAAGSCSSSLSGTFTVQNRAPTIISLSDAPDPVEAGNPITFSASWSDPGDSVRTVVCKTNSISAGTCTGGAWAVGSLSFANPSATSLTPWDIDAGTQTFYAFVCDAANACSSSVSGTFEVQPSLMLFDDLLAEVGERNAGFGGAYMDEGTGELFVYLTSPSQEAAVLVQEDLVEVLGDAALASLTAVPLQAEYGWLQMMEWYDGMGDEVWAVPGVVHTDIDDKRNRINIGVQNLDVQGPAIDAALTAAGVPADAVIVEEVDPGQPTSSVRDRHRPVVGGLQIEATINGSFEGLCTLGFNAVRTNQLGNENNGFVTASHCSAAIWTNDATIFWQPDKFNPTGDNMLGEETYDPPGFVRPQNSECPSPTIYCRYSDSSFIRYEDGVSFGQGKIARPAVEQSVVWDGSSKYKITGELPRHDLPGKTVRMVGRTSGYRNGNILANCVNQFNTVDNVVVLCSSKAQVTNGSGDSGAPIFKHTSGDDVVLAGLLFYSLEQGTVAVFSSITNIQKDLGSLRTKA